MVEKRFCPSHLYYTAPPRRMLPRVRGDDDGMLTPAFASTTRAAAFAARAIDGWLRTILSDPPSRRKLRWLQNQNGAARPRSNPSAAWRSLLDLGLAEFDVLARDRVVLLLDQLVGHGARILLGDVIEAGIRRGHELDLDGDRFGHVQDLK